MRTTALNSYLIYLVYPPSVTSGLLVESEISSHKMAGYLDGVQPPGRARHAYQISESGGEDVSKELSCPGHLGERRWK